MKVMFLFGGIPLYIDVLLKKLAEQGVEIIAVVPKRDSSVLGKGVEVTQSTTEFYRLIEANERQSVTGKNYFRNLPEIIAETRPDILVVGWPYFLAFYTQNKLRKALRKNNVRFVIREIPFQVPPYGKIRSYFRENPMIDEDMNVLSSGIGFYLRQQILMRIRKYCYSRANGALAYSSDGKKIMPTYGIDAEKVFVTYNSGDSDALLAQKSEVNKCIPMLPPNDYRIIHIGRLVKWKRVDLLIEAFQSVSEKLPGAELVIVGGGPELEKLKAQAKELGLNKKVIFTGALYNPADVGAYLNASSLYVLAGMGGLSINDAMTYGLPVICSVCDSTEKDLVTDDVNGYFFRNGDAADLAEKIFRVLSNPGLKEEMGKASLLVIEDKININSVSKRYKEAFSRIMQSAKREKK